MLKKSFFHVQVTITNRWAASGGVAIFCAFLVLGSIGVLAQEPATSLDELKLLVGKGDKVTLVDLSGKSIAGRIERIAPDTVEMMVGDIVHAYAEKDIRQINQRKRDSILNGLVIGAAVGFGATLPVNLAIAGSDDKNTAVAASAFWGLIGGGIGAIVDACLAQNRTIYFRPRSKVSLSIHPMGSRFQKPAHAALLSSFRPYTRIDPSRGIVVAIRF